MKSIYKMRNLFAFLICVIIFSSCESKIKKSVQEKDTLSSTNKNVDTIPSTKNITEKNWVDDFKDFRQAVLDNNQTKLKTYFDFPIREEGATIWYAVELSDAERKDRKSEVENSDYFYEKDFDKYHKRFLTPQFLKGILKIKSALLLTKGSAETAEFPDSNRPFIMYASIDKESKVFQLNMAFYNNGTDDEGNKVSEGEYNVIYLFDVIDGKKIRFKKLVVAG